MMGDRDRIVAIGLLSQRDLDLLGTGFRKAYPVDAVPMFADLLSAIDRVTEPAREPRDHRRGPFE